MPPLDKPAYAPLALWLTLLTNPQFPTQTADTIAAATNSPVDKVTKYLQLATSPNPLPAGTNTYAQAFALMRKRFQDLATDLNYPQGGCPAHFDTIKSVADLGK